MQFDNFSVHICFSLMTSVIGHNVVIMVIQYTSTAKLLQNGLSCCVFTLYKSPYFTHFGPW